MVALLAFLATALSTLFFEALLVRWTRRRRPHDAAWATAMAMFALASAAFAVGASTGWDEGTFRAFYLFGAVLNVPWLALGTGFLLAPRVASRARSGVLVFSGLAAGVVLAAPVEGVAAGSAIPEGRELFDAFPRVLAAIGSGGGALVVLAGAAWSAWRDLRPGSRRALRAGANALIAAGTLVLSAGGLLEGVFGGEDEAFAVTLVAGVGLLYGGFLAAGAAGATGEGVSQMSSRRTSLPPSPRGSASTNSIAEGAL